MVAHDDHHRLMLLESARRVIHMARVVRGSLPAQSSERAFYLGVEAAAEEVLHPELGMSRGDAWLARQETPFGEGYVRMADEIAVAKTLPEPPPRLILPEPRGASF